MKKRVEILDTTLRDGEQTHSVSFSPQEKLHITKLLLTKLHVDRVEVGSTRVSSGEAEAVKRIIHWTKKEDKQNLISVGSHVQKRVGTKKSYTSSIEVLGFLDKTLSVDWLSDLGGTCLNLLVKGSLHHLEKQLKKTPMEHITDILDVVEYATKKNISVNVYLEDYSNGFINSRNYTYELLDALIKMPIKRFMLPDTLGVLFPTQVSVFIQEILNRYPNSHFDFHGHNDYGLATINALEAIKSGIHGVHCTMNSLGERAGNTSLPEVVAGMKDHLNENCSIIEKNLYSVAKIIEAYSGKRISDNIPIVGNDVFTQTAGIHADGDQKGALYQSRLTPVRFGRKRSYALGKLAGCASLEQNLKVLGIQISQDEKKKVLQKVIELGDQKKIVYQEDLPFIISNVLDKEYHKIVSFQDVLLTTNLHVNPICSLQVLYNNKTSRHSGVGVGGYDAFMEALRNWAKIVHISLPNLVNYEVRIPPGGRTSALVECNIRWDIEVDGTYITEGVAGGVKALTTRGIHSDHLLAAVESTEKMLNIILQVP